MNRTARVAASDRSLFDAWRTLARSAEAGEVVEEPGLLFVSFGIPVVLLNAAFVTARPEDPEATLERARRFFDSRGLPFLLRMAKPVARVMQPAARRAGMAELDPLPGMVLDPVPVAVPPVPDGLSLQPAQEGEASMDDYRRVLSEGFEVPPSLAEIFAARAAVASARIRPLVGYLDEQPVACAALLLTGDVAGVYNVATTPAYRRRGFARALTAAAVSAGVESGAAVAALQSTPAGEPLYRKMGFRTVTHYRQFG
ncbi:MAG: GNAT family N-acetyltransferase [Actinobacteria bacterium]|nr:GNAT family N-acetyltransferase [Actinomycetota bacterium]MBW3650469.1 GNAT family N-acetyltransferase [Actinomycetota bacterium]